MTGAPRPSPSAPAERDAPPGHAPPPRLLFAVWGGPVATIVAFMGGVMSTRECDASGFVARAGLAALALLVSLAAGALSWRLWKSVGEPVPAAAGGKPGSRRFLTLMGLLGGGLGALLSLWLLVTVLVLDRCRP